MKCVDDFRLVLGGKEYVPIVIGGMGVDISTAKLALEAARLGGIGHISDAMYMDVSDRYFNTDYTETKATQYKKYIPLHDKTDVLFDLAMVAEATKRQVADVMERKRGDGLIFINCMEKLTMNAARDTLRTRLTSAMDAGIDGITLAAGLHQNTLRLIEDHSRFRDVKIGIIVSSHRALQIFLRRNAKLKRLPDYVVVEGPLAGGHLGFGLDWANYDLRTIVREVNAYQEKEGLSIPVIAGGGIFTGADAVSFLEDGASAVQVATRFAVTRESGLPDHVKQEYFKASEDDIEVNMASPTGYPMRMLKNSPALSVGLQPNCEAFGYLLDKGTCPYLEEYYKAVDAGADTSFMVKTQKTCLCTHMRNHYVWTCGHYAYRLKDTTHKLADGSYLLPSAEHVFKDYQFSKDGKIALPELPVPPYIVK
ncbi:MAG: nitronate monooxygenase [Oxalobacter sp.]|nr:nitronate monooxygenase [Oxalobacter sp.]